ncbi:hypothetical protein NKI89_31415 [Mesorhizobium sp. M0309]|uniref:hypothetical protein n=1 Tax=Mesorhizobium sp. M0309 TaxID=2956933 RepID=UPI00333B676C
MIIPARRFRIVDRKPGEIREAEIFVAVLGASSYTFAEAHLDANAPRVDWLDVRMFRFFCGVPKLVGRQSRQFLRSRDQPQLQHDSFPLWRRRSSGTVAAAEGQIESRERRHSGGGCATRPSSCWPRIVPENTEA